VALDDRPARPLELGLGTWAWGDTRTWGYGRDYGDRQLEEAFAAAVDEGVGLVDTAELYGQGRSELLVGRFLRSVQALERPVIATKFMPLPWRLTERSLVAALRRSLERLGLESVDLYLIHRPLPPRSAESWMDGLARAMSLGLTRRVGVCNYTAGQLRSAHARLAQRGIKLYATQVAYSLLHRDPEHDGIADACRELDVTLVAHNPLAGGLLAGQYRRDRPPPGRRGARCDPALLEQVELLTTILEAIGAEHGGRTPSQVALNWLICRGAIPIPGAKSAAQVRENAGARGWRLSAGDLELLDRATRPGGTES
jgi:aryl-alcohol dehydrogenase-like predicted oxidoreductase